MDKGLAEEVVQRWVELLADVLDEQRPSQRQTVLEVRAEVAVVQRRDLQLAGLLLHFDPVLTLTLKGASQPIGKPRSKSNLMIPCPVNSMC